MTTSPLSQSETHLKFFENLMSPNKEIRESAEKDLENIKKLPIQTTFPIFQSGMTSPNTNVAQLSTLLFRRVYLDNPSIKASLTIDTINQMKSFLKSLLTFNTNDTQWKTLQRIGDALAQLYQISDLQANFVEIIAWFNHDLPLSRRFAIYLIEVLCELNALNDTVISSSIEDFKSMFLKGLNDSDVNVRESSFKATVQCLLNIKDDKTVASFASVLCPMMLKALLASIDSDNEKKDLLEAMNHLTDYHSKFWKGNIEDVINVVHAIASNKALNSNIRELSLEIIYGIAKNTPAVLRKSQQFKATFIPMMFELLMEVDHVDNNGEWEKMTSDDEVDLSEMLYVIKRGFDRLSIDLGGKFFMEITNEFIMKFLMGKTWMEIHGAYMAIGAMAEGCAKVYKNHLLDLLNYISKGLTHEHIRVRYAALVALGALLKETAPVPQVKYCNNIMQGLAVLMTEQEPSVKIKTQACCALEDFLQGLLIENKNNDENSTLLKPYSDDLVKLLSTLFEHSLMINYAPLQEHSLSNISILANLLEKAFVPYYNQIMPGLKKLFFSIEPVSPAARKLRSHCIETISYLFSGVSEDSAKYMTDLKEISGAFAKALETLPEEDPQLEAILNAFTYISLAMEKEFIPYLDFLFPFLTKYINAEINLLVEDVEEKEYIPEEDKTEEEKAKIGSVMVSLGTKTKKLSVHTFALRAKIQAFNVLYEICLNMSKAFKPYTEQMLILAKNLLKFPYSRKVRKIAVKSISGCMNACDTDEERGRILQLFGHDLLGVLSYNITCCFYKEIKTYLKAFIDFCSLITDKTYINNAFIVQLYTCLNEILKKTNEKKKEIIALVAKDDDGHDENDVNDQQTDISNLNEINRRIMELNGVLFKTFSSELTEQVTTNLCDHFLGSWKEYANDQEVLYSICFFNDLMEYSTFQCFNDFYMNYIDMTHHKQITNEDILQTVIGGYGIICKRLPKTDASLIKIKEMLLKDIIITIERPVNDANENTYDSAIGAFGRYVLYQCTEDANGKEMARKFLNLLPLKHDMDEGKRLCKEVLDQIDLNNPLLLCEENRLLTKDMIKNMIDYNTQKEFVEEHIEQLVTVAVKFELENPSD